MGKVWRPMRLHLASSFGPQASHPALLYLFIWRFWGSNLELHTLDMEYRLIPNSLEALSDPKGVL